MEKPNSRTEGYHTLRTDDVHYDESFNPKSTTGLDEFYFNRSLEKKGNIEIFVKVFSVL